MLNLLLNGLVKTLGGMAVERLVNALVGKLTEWAVDRVVDEIETQDNTFDLERYYLYKKITQAKTDEERRILSITLARLHKYELPEPNSSRNSKVQQ